MSDVRSVDPATAKAAIKAVTELTHLQRCERALRIFMAAADGVAVAFEAGSDTQLETALFILAGAREETERLIGATPPEPPQAA